MHQPRSVRWPMGGQKSIRAWPPGVSSESGGSAVHALTIELAQLVFVFHGANAWLLYAMQS